jgi:hypothetical protein
LSLLLLAWDLINLLDPGSWRFTPMFFPGDVSVSALQSTLSTFLCVVKGKDPISFICLCIYSFFSTILWKNKICW